MGLGSVTKGFKKAGKPFKKIAKGGKQMSKNLKGTTNAITKVGDKTREVMKSKEFQGAVAGAAMGGTSAAAAMGAVAGRQFSNKEKKDKADRKKQKAANAKNGKGGTSGYTDAVETIKAGKVGATNIGDVKETGRTQIRKSAQSNIGVADVDRTRVANAALADQSSLARAGNIGAAGVSKTGAITGATVDTTEQERFRTDQETLAADLQSTAPSAAEMQLRRTTDQNIANQLAIAQSRGGNVASAQRVAAQNIAQLNQQAAEQGAILRAGEQQQRQTLLGQTLAQGRGQDIELAQTQAGLTQQAATTSAQLASQENISEAQFAQQASIADKQLLASENALEAQLEQAIKTGNQSAINSVRAQQANITARRGEITAQLRTQVEQGNQKAEQELVVLQANLDNAIATGNTAAANSFIARQAEIEAEREKLNAQLATQTAIATQQSKDDRFSSIMNFKATKAAAKAQAKSDAKAQKTQLAGSLIAGGAAVIAAMSDERLKENIEDSDISIRQFLNALNPKKYDYKQAGKSILHKNKLIKMNPGKHVSVMAQDLEKTEIGKQMVADTPQGKVVDYAQGLAALFASIANVNKRVNKLEVV